LLSCRLVACQLRIAALKDELAASKQRLEDEQTHEAQLTQRALQLEAEAQAAARKLIDSSFAAGAPVPAIVAAADHAFEQQQHRDKQHAAVGTTAAGDTAESQGRSGTA